MGAELLVKVSDAGLNPNKHTPGGTFTADIRDHGQGREDKHRQQSAISVGNAEEEIASQI